LWLDGISRRQVEAERANHLSAIYAKLQVADRTQAILHARDAGLTLIQPGNTGPAIASSDGLDRRDAFKHRCATQRTMIGRGCGAPKALVSVIANGTANNRCLDLIPGTDASKT